MAYLSKVLESMGILLFCGFMSIFIIPRIFFWVFYTIPQILRFSAAKKMRLVAIMSTIQRLAMWLAIIGVLFVIAFFTDQGTFFDLLISPTALFCWFIAVVVVLWNILFSRRKIQDDFYDNIYLKFITDEEKEKYDKYIERAGKFTHKQAMHERQKKLSYLQKKVVANRISFLVNNPTPKKKAPQAR